MPYLQRTALTLSFISFSAISFGVQSCAAQQTIKRNEDGVLVSVPSGGSDTLTLMMAASNEAIAPDSTELSVKTQCGTDSLAIAIKNIGGTNPHVIVEEFTVDFNNEQIHVDVAKNHRRHLKSFANIDAIHVRGCNADQDYWKLHFIGTAYSKRHNKTFPKAEKHFSIFGKDIVLVTLKWE